MGNIFGQDGNRWSSNSNFEKISYLKFNNNTRDMKMEEIKPRYGEIWPGLKGLYILALG